MGVADVLEEIERVKLRFEEVQRHIRGLEERLGFTLQEKLQRDLLLILLNFSESCARMLDLLKRLQGPTGKK